MGEAELVVGISSLVYIVGIIISTAVPTLRAKVWGRALVMHSVTSLALIAVAGSISALKVLLDGLIGLPLTAGFDRAMAAADSYTQLVWEWARSIGLAGVALGSIMAVTLLALTPAFITGVGVLFASIASYIFSALFGTLIFVQKIFTYLMLFSEFIRGFLAIANVVGPGMFSAGLILFSIPFARKLGKTFLVLGSALTLFLPTAIVMALPSPDQAHQRMEEAAEVQALSIASKVVADIQGGARLRFLDRPGKIVVGEGEVINRTARVLKYPYFKLEPQHNFNITLIACNLYNVDCSEVGRILAEIIDTPETGFVDSYPLHYNSNDEGYRLTLTMPLKSPEVRSGEFKPYIWIHGLWLKVRYNGTGYNETSGTVRFEGPPLPDKPKNLSGDPYIEWRREWESYWSSTNRYDIYMEAAVAENDNSTFIWFTKQPWGSNEPLNVFYIPIALPEQLVCIKSDGGYDLVAPPTENTVTYFIYLDGTMWEVRWLEYREGWHVEVSNASLEELKSLEGVEGVEYPLNREPSLQSVEKIPSLSASPPVNAKKVTLVKERQKLSSGDSCEEAYLNYLQQLKEGDINTDACPSVDTSAIDEEIERVANATREGQDIIPEPGSVDNPCGGGGVQWVKVTLIFSASEANPYISPVDWRKFEEDEEYLSSLASGGYISDLNIKFETHREEWKNYKPFRQGVYRDGPPEEANRRLTEKFQEYRNESWAENLTVFGVPIGRNVVKIYRTAVNATATHVPIPIIPLVATEAGVIGIAGILDIIAAAWSAFLALLVFALATDVIAGLVGGQSALYSAFKGIQSVFGKAPLPFSRTLSTIRKMERFSLLGRLQAEREKVALLKAALEKRRLNREEWRSVRDSLVQDLKSSGLASRLKAYTLTAKGLVAERALSLAEKHHMIAYPFSGYTRTIYTYGLATDKAFRGSAPPDLATNLLQSRKARMEPEKFAEGAARMVINTPTRLDRIALSDQLARRAPDIGRSTLLSYTVGGVGERLRNREGILGKIGSAIGSGISAPVAYLGHYARSLGERGEAITPSFIEVGRAPPNISFIKSDTSEVKPPVIEHNNSKYGVSIPSADTLGIGGGAWEEAQSIKEWMSRFSSIWSKGALVAKADSEVMAGITLGDLGRWNEPGFADILWERWEMDSGGWEKVEEGFAEARLFPELLDWKMPNVAEAARTSDKVKVGLEDYPVESVKGLPTWVAGVFEKDRIWGSVETYIPEPRIGWSQVDDTIQNTPSDQQSRGGDRDGKG